MSAFFQHIRHAGKSATDYAVVATWPIFVVGNELLNPDLLLLHIVQLQLEAGLEHKTHLLAIAVDQLKRLVRAGNRQRNAGNTGTGACIDKMLPFQQWQNRQAVENMPVQHLLRVANGGQVIGLVPAV